MKKIGLLGGLGPEATIDYYKQILHAFQEGNTDLNYPEMISTFVSHVFNLPRNPRVLVCEPARISTSWQRSIQDGPDQYYQPV